MRKSVHKIGVLFLSTIIGVALLAPTAFANSTNVGIEPAYPDPENQRTESIFIMHLKPEEQGKNGVRLINTSKETRTVEIYPTDSVWSASGSFSCRQRSEKIKDVGGWITLDKTEATLQPGEQTVVDFTVDVPKGTGPGEHDGCIAVQDLANLPATSGSGVLLGVRSAIRLAVTVPGKIVKKLDIVKVEIKHVENRGISVSPIAKNSGNVSLDVTARAQLVSIFGQETAIKSDAKYPVMQGATTGWAYVFDGPYWGGIYKARTSLSYNADPNVGLGQGESNQQRIRGDSGWFIAFPHPLAAAAELAVFVAVIWLLVTPLRRRLQRRRAMRHWQKYTVGEGETLAVIAKSLGVKWKTIARHNRIKAPYTLAAGRTILVPHSRLSKKTAKRSKAAASGLDWLSDDVAATPPATDPAPTPIATAPDRPVTSPEVSRTELRPSGEEVSSREDVDQPAVHTVSKPVAAPSNPLFPEPDEVNVLDWREGASEEELRQFGIITDSASVSPLQDSWSIDWDETKPSTKKPVTKRSALTKSQKKSTKKVSVKRSSDKKK